MIAVLLAIALAQATLGDSGSPSGVGILPVQGAIRQHLLASGTPIELMVINEVSTRQAKAGVRFVVQVNAPVMLGDRVAIPIGAPGVGEIVAASTSGIGGRSGKLATRLLYVDVAGRHVMLGGHVDAVGQGAGAQMILFSVLVNPVGIFTRGNNARLKAGQIVTATTAETFDCDAVEERVAP